MPSTYSTNLALELIGTGDQAGSWGNTTNTNLGTLIEQAISGYVTQAVATGTDTTITIPNGATGVARNMYIELTGTGGTNTNLIVPANKKLYFIFNNSTGAVTVKVSGQTGVSVPQGKKVVLTSNGTDVVNGLNYIADFGSNSATITQLTATSATITNLTLTSLIISNLSIASANITTLTGTNLTYTSGTVTNLNSTSANITTLTGTTFGTTATTHIGAASATITNLNSTSANITTLTGTTFGTTATTQLRGASGAITTLTGTSADITTITGTTIGTTASATIRGVSGAITTISGTTATYTSATVTNLALTSLTLSNLSIASANITTLTSTNATAASLTVSTGNLTFSSTAQRITGDMSNATVSNRLMFQSSVADSSTSVNAIPSGTGTASNIRAVNNSTPTNSAFTGLAATSSESQLVAGIYGTGTYLPMTFYTGGSERMRLDTSGNLGIGGTPGAALSINKQSTALSGTGNSYGVYVYPTSTGATYVDAVTSLSGTTSLNLRTYNNGTYNQLVMDSSGNVGIGTTSPSGKLQVIAANTRVRFSNTAGTASTLLFGADSGQTFLGTETNGPIYFITNNTECVRIDTSGNVAVGTTNAGTAGLSLSQNYNLSWEQSATESVPNLFRQTSSAALVMSVGYKRSATANGFASSFGSSLAKTAISLGTTAGAITFYTDTAATTAVGTDVTPTERMRIDSSGNVGIGGTAAAYEKISVSGTYPTSSNVSQGFVSKATIPSGATSSFVGYYSVPSTQAAAFTCTSLYHFLAGFGTKGASSAITTQYGFLAGSDLTGATNNYGFYSDIASGSNRWNFYAAGTAANYFAGNVGIGVTPPSTVRLDVQGITSAAGNYTVAFRNSSTTNLFYIEDHGTIFTGGAANSPYNLTTGSAANVFVDSGGALYRSTSSLRYKSDVTNATHGLADVLKLRSVTYKAKNSGDTVFGGLIAEEVHDAGLTEFVAYDKEGRPDALHYGNMVALLVKAVQELSAKVAALEAK